MGLSVDDPTFFQRIDAGVLVAPSVRLLYPIVRGLPVMLPYRTGVHQHFINQFSTKLAQFTPRYGFPSCRPMPGERAVFRSFSREWAGYKYDGVIWDLSYEDNERRLLAELDLTPPLERPQTFLEVGCGIGVTSAQAQRHLRADAVGVDLSYAVVAAAEHHRSNPFLHFVQGSAFYLPFAQASFDCVYSRGVLHHTYSTRTAFLALARCCKPGGRTYIWVYGPGSISATPLRRALYGAELALRAVLSRAPGAISTAVLAPIAIGYITYNRHKRARNAEVQPFTFERALHSARDRFTPRFAHRQDAAQVVSWFREAGFDHIEVADWRRIPSADQDDYRRNVGVRGLREAAPAAADSSTTSPEVRDSRPVYA